MDQMDQIQARSVVYPTMTDMYRVYGHSHMLHLYTIIYYIYITLYYRDLYNKYNKYTSYLHLYIYRHSHMLHVWNIYQHLL